MKPKHFAAAAVMITLVFLMNQCGKDEGTTQPTTPPPIITTVDTIPPASINDLVAKLPASKAIYLTWTAPGDDGDQGTATSYDVRYHVEEINETNWEDAQRFSCDTAPKQGGAVEIVRVISLDPVTTYFFAVKTTDDEGNVSGISNPTSSTTLQEVTPPIPVADLEAVAIDDDSFLITWSAPGDDGDEGTASQYEIRYSKQSITPANWNSASLVSSPPVPKPAGEPESLLVSGLSGSSSYNFAIKAADEVPNWSDISNVAHGLGYRVYLETSAYTVEVGDEVKVLFRAPGGEQVSILLNQYGISCTPNVWTRDVVLPGVGYPEGVYEISYDFRKASGQYLPAARYYFVLCWQYELKTYNAVVLADPYEP